MGVAALIPSVIGYLWYGPIMGKQWVASTGKTAEWYEEQGNMPRIMAISLLLSLLLSWVINVFILLTHGNQYMEGCENIAGTHGTFGHGALHGAMFAALWVIPLFVINGMFERRGPKNYWIHIVYWIICAGIMGGIVDAWR